MGNGVCLSNIGCRASFSNNNVAKRNSFYAIPFDQRRAKCLNARYEIGVALVKERHEQNSVRESTDSSKVVGKKDHRHLGVCFNQFDDVVQL